ncbi:hypothetical protein [Dyadobacter bucti]|uniref:hypothetical protein n=1 Tax=Dyadobacter bucti TaxID=2572203 RepID=UPI00197B05FD|nr:hypothetical protein [Dyadobacter bucti]
MYTSYLKRILRVGIFSAFTLTAHVGFCQDQESNGIQLEFSDGRPNAVGFKNANAILSQIGVHASLITIPVEAKDILTKSFKRAITEKEHEKLIALFTLNKDALLKQINLAGRKPEVANGGNLNTSEIGVKPYPKIYDMKAMNEEQQAGALRKFGKFHVNSSDDGIGIDEVMTVVAGGPFKWFFILPDQTIVKLTVKNVTPSEQAVRLSYPGLGIHAGYMDPKNGLIVAYAHGPENFVMRYEKAGIRGEKFLGTNPWVDFSGPMPKIKDKMEL